MEPEANPAGGAEGAADPRADLAKLVSASDDGSINATPETEEEQPTEEVQADQEPEAEPEFTVKVDGKEFRVKQSELINGYQRDSDYRAKTMALSDERKAAETAKAQASQRAQQLDAALTQVIARLEYETQDHANLDQLLETNPQEYLKQRHAQDKKRAELAEAKIAHENLRHQQAQEYQEQQSRFIESERQRLVQVLPEWKDEAKAKAEKGQLATYLRSQYGFSDEQLGQLSDHRDVLIARKAMLYDQLLQQKPVVDKKVKQAPPRAESPGTHQSPDKSQNFQAAMRQLGKSGSREDGRNAIRALLG